MESYIAQIGAFLAAIVAIGEPTWDSSKKGIRRLRPMGYFAAAIAVISFTASITITIDANETEKHKKEQRAIMQTIGNTEICVAASNIKLNIDVLSNMGKDERSYVGANLGITFSELVSEGNLSKLESIDLSETISIDTKIGDVRPLSQYLSEEMAKNVESINTTISKYGFFWTKRSCIFRA
ncbi:hypothetical protein [Aurantivibrio plasticivorans]